MQLTFIYFLIINKNSFNVLFNELKILNMGEIKNKNKNKNKKNNNIINHKNNDENDNIFKFIREKSNRLTITMFVTFRLSLNIVKIIKLFFSNIVNNVLFYF